ncbi:MAG TPA: formylmethanofuran dehydrogenase [Desulfobacteraceae bacterium]|nr:formylmethanofuran dehydrogenase [Desulfobacteraceae bacterium]
MQSFASLLAESVQRHGHLCAGQIIGVRMATLGCRLVGITDPKDPAFRKKLMVFVEIDRCATDAIESVTGCRLGRRTLKFKDFGINGATFLNLETGTAYRIVSTESSRDLAAGFAPDAPDARARQIEGYRRMPDELLFDVHRVRVRPDPCQMPGPPRRRVVCGKCGQMVRDGRELRVGEALLCRHCAGESYFDPVDEQKDSDPRAEPGTTS